MSDSFLIFDVGNSRIKASQVRGGKLGPLRAAFLDDQPGLQSLIEWPDACKECRAFISSVNPPASARLIEQLAGIGVPTSWHLLSNGELFRDGYLTCHPELANSTGVDRMLSSIAVQRRFPSQPAIVVDCGSAVTVNFTDATGCFQGGAILPGRRLMTQALSNGTAELPKIQVSVPRSPIGRNTLDAITAGIAFSIGGGVRRLVDEFCVATASPGPKVVLTGGDAAFVASLIGMATETFAAPAIPHSKARTQSDLTMANSAIRSKTT
jgi:type III pantothenate kinase